MNPMPRTMFVSAVSEDIAALDAHVAALHGQREALDAELKTAEAERARLDGVLEDGADAAYDRAAAVVRTARRSLAALDSEITDVRQRLHAGHVAHLRAEETADAEDRATVERVLVEAAETLAAYEGRLLDRWNRKNELGLRMPSRLDALPARIVHRLAAQHFVRFGLASPLEGKRIG